MKCLSEQTISVGKEANLNKLLTLCLLKFSEFDKLKIIAAGGSINDAILLALRLTTGKISKVPVGVKLVSIHSIATRADITRKIVAIGIYIRKGSTTEYSKRHLDLLKKINADVSEVLIEMPK
jgi:DNA-binding protein